MITIIELIIACLGVVFGLCYVILIGLYCYGWLKTPLYEYQEVSTPPMVSIIIAARNEEESIINCLQHILKQEYSKAFYEIIVIDDHSTDNTFQLVNIFSQNTTGIKIIRLQENQTGKKNAIEAGIKIAKGDIIVTTDADCVMNKRWLQTIVSFLINSNSKMVVGPADYMEENTLLNKFQKLELIALISSGAGSLYYNKAILCNGANLAYYKAAFNEVGGYEGIQSFASGDDVLLMYKIKEKFPSQISFVKHTDAIVYTKAKETVKEIFHQRKRWSSKKISLLNSETKFVAFVVLGFNVLVLLMLFFCGFSFFHLTLDSSFMYLSFILVGIKWVIDFLFLFLATPFFNQRKLLLYFIPEQLFYSVYILIIGLFGSFGNYEWKGRKIKV